MKNLRLFVGTSHSRLAIIGGFTAIGLVGLADFLTGYDYSFSLFYVLAVGVIAWNANLYLATTAALLSTAAWQTAEIASGRPYHIFSVFWNGVIRFALLTVVAVLTERLHNTMRHEAALANTDYLTSAANTRHFRELASKELDRLARYHHPFTVIYLDLDNFKSINDTFGHSFGDQVLQSLAHSLIANIRKGDTLARLGGDEFILLFPETDAAAAHMLWAKIQSIVLQEIQQNGWAITLSAGAVTCETAPPSVDELVKIADALMYAAKLEGKNTVKYQLYAQDPSTNAPCAST